MGDTQLIRWPSIEAFDGSCNPAHVFELQFFWLAQHDVATRHAVNVEDIGSIAELIRHNLGCSGRDFVGAGDSLFGGGSLSSHVTQA